MPANLTVALECDSPSLGEELANILSASPDVSLTTWKGETGVKGTPVTSAAPDVILIDDAPPQGTLTERISRLRTSYPHASVFVASSNRQPEQIVSAMKAGAAEFLLSPLEPSLLEQALDEVRSRLSREAPLHKGRIFSFISAKGGLGSTVLSVNTAVTLALRKKTRVSLCDLSCQSGDSTVLLDIMPKTNMADISANFHRLDPALLRDCMARHDSGLEVLSAPFRPERSEEIRPDHVHRIMELLKTLYDVTLIDCASIFVNDCLIESFRCADKVFIVIDLSVPAIRNATRLARLITDLGLSSRQVEFVVNRYHKNGSLPLEEAEETLKKRVYWLFPNDFQDIVQSINRGVPIVQLMPQSTLALNINEFSDRLVNPRANPEYRGVRGMFGKAL